MTVISVTVRDRNGLTASASATADVTAPGGSIPLTFNDPRFAGNTTSASRTLANGASLSKVKITDTGSTASVVCQGAATITDVAINSREGIRVGGSGLVNITGTYFRAVGVGADHADGLQAYAPGSRGEIRVTNSCGEIGGVSTAAFFVADGWGGTIRITNCVFTTLGAYGVRIHSDAGSGGITLYFNDVYIVGSPPLLITNEGGGLTIAEWNNVRRATIVNGAVVPGAVLPRPL